MATCMFNVGDMVVGNHPNRYYCTKLGWKGVVEKVHWNGYIDVRGEGNPQDNMLFTYLESKYFDKLPNEEKIVITHNGKITTATMYGVMGKVTATARCAPDDKFDFNVGAKLAMERLMEKVEPVPEPDETDAEWRVVNRMAKVGDFIRLKTNGMYPWNKPGDILKVDEVGHGTVVRVRGMNHIRKTENQNFMWAYVLPEYEVVEKINPINIDGYKVGDRVNFNGTNGTVICLAASGGNRIGVEFDKEVDINHRCENIPLIAGTTGTKRTCRWMYAHEIEHGEAPKYYNGKVVCVSNKHKGSFCSCKGFTVGKIYEVTNGKVTGDNGWTCNYRYKSVEDLSQCLGNTFLGIVK